MEDLAQKPELRQLVVRAAGLYNLVLSDAARAEAGLIEWAAIRRDCLHMAGGLSVIVHRIRVSSDQALVRLAMVLLANVVVFAVAKHPDEVNFKRLTRAEDLAKLVTFVTTRR